MRLCLEEPNRENRVTALSRRIRDKKKVKNVGCISKMVRNIIAKLKASSPGWLVKGGESQSWW
ncbi:hypothetical protein E2C01_067151 [Portunus trituberculatus]|uniref:Uncharacterized protein n=1 Tax=Portunus trituberculatus TaxID=210409 RepID=A0A5B7HU94_PORTR|nr:hypothetical protein [Portunus trituberculatus]